MCGRLSPTNGGCWAGEGPEGELRTRYFGGGKDRWARRRRSRRRRRRRQGPKHRSEVARSSTTVGRAAGRSRTGHQCQDEAQGVRARTREAAGWAGRDAGVGQGHGGQGLHRVRRTRHGRQGGDDQADRRAGEPPRVPRRRPAGADRAREVTDVHPALHPALPRRRRGRDLRPQLVQPRRGRAGHGLLRRGARPRGSWSRSRPSSRR